MTRMFWVQCLLAHHVATPAIVLDLHLVFRVHGVLLALDVFWAEQRVDEEVAETVEALGKRTVFDIEKVVGVI